MTEREEYWLDYYRGRANHAIGLRRACAEAAADKKPCEECVARVEFLEDTILRVLANLGRIG